MSQNHIPLMMGEKIIGAISIDMDEGTFTGRFDKPAIDILRDGMANGARVVKLESILGMASQTDMTPQERWRAYLQVEADAAEIAFYTIREALGEGRVFRRNVHGLANAEAEGKWYHELTHAVVTWEKQTGWIKE